MTKKTLVLGASLKPERYSNIAIHMLREHAIDTVAFGLREGLVGDVTIISDLNHPTINHIHTITLYLNAQRQSDYYDFILRTHPKRVIFNPGTSNMALETLLNTHNIAFEHACTLVLLRTQQY